MKGQQGFYTILANSPEDVAKISSAIDEMFRNSPQPTETETEKAFQLGFLAMLGNVKAFILSICGAVVFAILLVSANTMAMSIRERTREVAVLKTLGFTRKTVSEFVCGRGGGPGAGRRNCWFAGCIYLGHGRGQGRRLCRRFASGWRRPCWWPGW